MRTVLIAATIAGGVLSFAVPASAQYRDNGPFYQAAPLTQVSPYGTYQASPYGTYDAWNNGWSGQDAIGWGFGR
jgi:hypothetical protein